jgi:tripartite-type tricarboxylate transporter receptor subunit TctC
VKSKHLFWSVVAGVILAGIAMLQPAFAQSTYPNKPITLVVPFAPGSGSDLTARALSKDMSAVLKQPVVVSNRPGANGAIGAAAVANAAPDGYTLLLGSGTTQAANFAFQIGNMGYKPDSLIMVSGIGASPVMLFVANAEVNTSVGGLVQQAKKNIGKMSCSSGNAVTEVACAVFKKQAAIFAPTIPYRSNAQSLQDLAGGIISFTFSDPPAALSLVDAKRIKPLAVASNKRLSAFKDVPTFAEAGYKDFEITAWTGLFAPAGTPRDILEKLNVVVRAHVDSEEVSRFMARYGGYQLWMTVDESQRFLQQEQAKWKRYVTSTGIKPYL